MAEQSPAMSNDADLSRRLLAGDDARTEDHFEVLGAVLVDRGEVFVGDAAQLLRQLAGDAVDAEALVGIGTKPANEKGYEAQPLRSIVWIISIGYLVKMAINLT